MRNDHDIRHNTPYGGVISADRKMIFGILLSALAIRITLSALIHSPVDSVTLKPLGTVAGDGTAAVARSPLGSFVLRMAFAVFGDSNYMAFFIIQGLLGTLSVLLIYYITCRLQTRNSGIAAAVIAAVYPNFIIYCLALDTKNLSVLFVAIMISALVSRLDDRRKAALTGMATGMAILLEPVFFLFVPGMVYANRKRLVYIAVFAALLLPWTVWNSVQTGKPVPVFSAAAYGEHFSVAKFTEAKDLWETAGSIYGNVSALMIKSWEDHKQPQETDGGRPFALEYALKEPEGRQSSLERSPVVKGTPRNAGYLAAYSYVLVMVLGITGYLKCYRREHRLFVIQASAFLLLLVLLASVKAVHRAIVEPLLIIYAAIFIGTTADAFYSRLKSR